MLVLGPLVSNEQALVPQPLNTLKASDAHPRPPPPCYTCLLVEEQRALDLTHPLNQAPVVSEQPVQLYGRPPAVQPKEASFNGSSLSADPPILILCFDSHITQTQASPRAAQGKTRLL